MPAFKVAKIGVWEDETFIGAVLFGMGATKHLGSPYGLNCFQVCELVRVALTTHNAPVTRIIRIAISMVKKRYRGLRLIVSFADPEQGHIGTIYQAGNWIYSGSVASGDWVKVHNKTYHPRGIVQKYGHRGIAWLRANVDPNAKVVMRIPKYRYLMPLDKGMARVIASLRQPYPKQSAAVV